MSKMLYTLLLAALFALIAYVALSPFFNLGNIVTGSLAGLGF